MRGAQCVTFPKLERGCVRRPRKRGELYRWAGARAKAPKFRGENGAALAKRGAALPLSRGALQMRVFALRNYVITAKAWQEKVLRGTFSVCRLLNTHPNRAALEKRSGARNDLCAGRTEFPMQI